MHPFRSSKHTWKIFCALIFVGLVSHSAHAAWEAMPDNRHQLYENLGEFFDEQTMLINYEQSRLWLSIGGAVPLAGNNESEGKPQFVLHATANAGLHYDGNFRFYTETVDARFGLDFTWEFSKNLRGSIGITHNSAHAADGMAESDLYNSDHTLGGLFTPPLGEEFIPIRMVYDYENIVRIGGEFRPFIRTAPSLLPLGFEEFIDYMPWGAKDDPHHATPFVALGLLQYGPVSYTNTLNFVVGMYFGNHMSGTFHQQARVILGYYTGADPRLKYFQFQNITESFFYYGMAFSL